MNKIEKPATKITYQGYSWGLKISIIEQIENGQISINQAAKKYGVDVRKKYLPESLRRTLSKLKRGLK